MKRILLLTVISLICGLSAFAQDLQEEKVSLYTQFVTNIKGDASQQKLAYQQGQEYLTKYGADQDQYIAYIRKWNAKYEKVAREVDFNNALAAKDWAKGIAVGKQILTIDGENFIVMTRLVDAGYRNAVTGNKSLNTDSIALARKSLAMLESGKVTDPAPFKSLEDASGFLNYTLAWLIRETSPAEAAQLVHKAANSSAYKNLPGTYLLLASTTIAAEYEPQANEYNLKYGGKEVTPEGEAMAAKVKAVAERVIDAYARAAALLTKPEQQKDKAAVMEDLTDLYKTFHSNSDAGLNELIASVLAKPLP
jgi:hypothetical protein